MAQPEPHNEHQPAEARTEWDVLAEFRGRVVSATKQVRIFATVSTVLLIASLCLGEPFTRAALVASAMTGFIAAWSVVVKEKYDGLLHMFELHRIVRPEAGVEFWMPQFLAEKLSSNEAVAKSSEAANNALLALQAVLEEHGYVRES